VISLDYHWILYQFLPNVGFILALVLIAHLIQQRRAPVSTIAWLLTIVLLPYVGVPLYLMIGGRKMRRMAAQKAKVYLPPHSTPVGTLESTVERILQSYGVPSARAGNRVTLVPNGEEAHRQLIQLIDAAQRSIQITTYILGRDPVGGAIVERLARRASEGIAVRLLLDDVGSWRVGRRFLAPLTDAGAKVAFFMPMLHLPFRGRANLRNHRKIVVVDGRSAMVGGMNLAREYMGPTPERDRWRDLSLIVTGPTVGDLADLCRSDWTFATGETLPADDESPVASGPGEDIPVQVVASGPDVAGDPFYESLVTVLFAARRRIWAVTPYFVPDETLVRALELAARRGVDVRVLVPARSNHLMADLARGSYLRQVQEAGGQVLLDPSMFHAKVILIDDDLAIVGSANMDMRSLFLNYEVALFLYSKQLTAKVADWIQPLMAESHPESPVRGRVRTLAEDMGRLLSPML
jgi:cardiolipin synthase A/B